MWCTHFIAMLAYEPGTPVAFDPLMTMVSLLVAIAGAGAGFIVAGSAASGIAPLLGGAIAGLAIAVMHYTGMMAYRVEGIISWDMTYLVASVVLSVGVSASSLYLFARKAVRGYRYVSAGLLFLAIIGLHFIGMAAFQVTPLLNFGEFANPAEMEALALAVAGVALLIVGVGLASYLIDDSTRVETREKLRHMASVDGMTGLPNRTGFIKMLDHEIRQSEESDGKVAVIGIDLNRFKELNDTRGHEVGDLVLRMLAKRFGDLLRDGEFMARTGGDEFAVIQRVKDLAGLDDLLNRLQAAVCAPIDAQQHGIVVGAGFGVAIYPDNATSRETLVSNASLAMYRAKADLAHPVCYYDQSMDEIVRERRNLVADLRAALDEDQLDVHYQVQTSVSTGEISGFEALVRWTHPERGSIPPSEFISLAEENGLILKLGEWVLRRACTDAASWKQNYRVAVNVSPVQIGHSDLSQLIIDVLLFTGLPASRLELELTESTILQDRQRSFSMLRKIKALGVYIALDDFGTGYSSLEMLRAFPFDKIKLDRSFISESEDSVEARAIIRAVMALGKSLNIPILAEGIETEGQFSLLKAEGCDEVQGYLLGRPVPMRQLLESGKVSPKADGSASLTPQLIVIANPDCAPASACQA